MTITIKSILILSIFFFKYRKLICGRKFVALSVFTMLLDQVIMTDLTRVEEIRRQWNLNELRSVYVRQFCLILVFNIFIPYQILTCFFLPRSLCLITPSWGKRLLSTFAIFILTPLFIPDMMLDLSTSS